MAEFKVTLKKSVNGIPFFTKKADVRSILGKPDYNTKEERKMTAEKQRALDLMEVAIKEAYKEMNKDPAEFKWPDISEYESDLDGYGKYQLEYDNQDRLVSACLISEYAEGLVICNTDCSDFSLRKLLSLSDDFIKEDDGASYVSYSLQIGIYCPDMDERVESIVFGCEGYFQPEEN